MTGGAFLIDPTAKEVVEVKPEEGDFLEWVRNLLGVPQVAVMPVNQSTVAIWCDNMGMIRPGRDFWSFKLDAFRFAGKCLITAINPEEGTPAPLPENVTAERILDSIRWHPSEMLLKLTEEMVIVHDAEGRKVPGVARRVLWKDEPGKLESVDVADDISSGWSIFEKPDGTYKAERYALEDDALRLVEMRSAPNLDAMRAKLPAGLIRIEADEREDAIEHWMVPLLDEEG